MSDYLNSDGGDSYAHNQRPEQQEGREELGQYQNAIGNRRSPQEWLDPDLAIAMHGFAGVEDRHSDQEYQQRSCSVAGIGSRKRNVRMDVIEGHFQQA